MILVSTDRLDNNLSDNAKLIDASWHFLSNRSGFEEYQKEHIENAIEVTSASSKFRRPTKIAHIATAPTKDR